MQTCNLFFVVLVEVVAFFVCFFDTANHYVALAGLELLILLLLNLTSAEITDVTHNTHQEYVLSDALYVCKSVQVKPRDLRGRETDP